MMQSDGRHKKQAPCSWCAPCHKGCRGQHVSRNHNTVSPRLTTASNCTQFHVPKPKGSGGRATYDREADKHWTPLSEGEAGDKWGESAGARRRCAAGPRERNNRVGVERGDEVKAQKRRLQLRPTETTWGPGPGISDQREGEGHPQTEAREPDPRCAWPGRGGRAHRSPVLFEKLVRLPKAVVEQHVDAGQGQLRVLQGRRRSRGRVSVVPPPRPLLLGAGHGSARLCAGTRRGGVAAAAGPARAPRAGLYLPKAQLSPAVRRGGAGRGGEGGAGPAAERLALGAPRPPPPAAAGYYSAAAHRPAPPAPSRTPGSRGLRSRIRFRVYLTLRNRGPSGCQPCFLQSLGVPNPRSPHRAPRPAVPGQRAEPAGTRARPWGLDLDRPLLQKGRTPGSRGSGRGQASGFEKGTGNSSWVAAGARTWRPAGSSRHAATLPGAPEPHAASARDPQIHPVPGTAHQPVTANPRGGGRQEGTAARSAVQRTWRGERLHLHTHPLWPDANICASGQKD